MKTSSFSNVDDCIAIKSLFIMMDSCSIQTKLAAVCGKVNFFFFHLHQQVTAREVQSSLIPILQTFHERSMYLNCLLNPATPSLAALQAGFKRKEEKKEEERKEEKGSKGALKLVGTIQSL